MTFENLESQEQIEEFVKSIFIEGYLSARFDKLVEDECDAHLNKVPEGANDAQLEAALDEFWNDGLIYEAAVVKANKELEIMYDSFFESANASWEAREEMMERDDLALQGGGVGEA